MSGKIRVLVVDDSAFMRLTISRRLAADPELEVLDTARDGIDALDKIARLSPDVVTLDVEMPKLDGLGTLEQLMRRRPTPVVMLSSLTAPGSAATVKALELGAIDFASEISVRQCVAAFGSFRPLKSVRVVPMHSATRTTWTI